MPGQYRPRNAPEWMRWVEARLRRLDARIDGRTPVPIGGAVLWPAGGAAPGGWLTANGGTFDGTEYPDLADRLGSTTLPNLTPVSGSNWILRAE